MLFQNVQLKKAKTAELPCECIVTATRLNKSGTMETYIYLRKQRMGHIRSYSDDLWILQRQADSSFLIQNVTMAQLH